MYCCTIYQHHVKTLMASYLIPAETVTTERRVKNSRFICSVGHAETREDALAAIREIRAHQKGATHVCWAFIAGPPDSADRGMSDDGEPHGTAGRPMLTVLEHSGGFWAIARHTEATRGNPPGRQGFAGAFPRIAAGKPAAKKAQR